jgi:hypothetical protein
MFGAPMLAVVHGGERISGLGSGGGGPVNIDIDMSGATISNEIDKADLLNEMAQTIARLFSSANSSTRAGAPSTLIGA